MLLGAPLAIGGVHVVSRATLAGLAALAWVWCAFKEPSSSRTTGHTLWRTLTALAILTLVQLLPLPALWIGSFFEGRVETLHGIDRALAVPPRQWISWALDPGRTSAAVLDLLGWISLVATVGFLGRDRSAPVVISSLVVLAGLGVFAVGAVQFLTGTEEILGLYRPDADMSGEVFMTTFVNPNHGAALLLMGSLVSFGLWLDSRETAHARPLLLIAALLGLGVLATGSTANSLLLAGGLPMIGLWTSRRFEGQQRARVLRALMGSFMLGAIAIMVTDPVAWWNTVIRPYLAAQDPGPWSRLEEIWRVGVSVVQAHPGLGVGFGSFPIESAKTMDSWNSGFITFAHNLFLEGAASWGLFVMALLALVVFITLVRAARGAQSGVQVAIVVALTATIVQNGVDFSLQIPGVGYCWAALLGTILVSLPDGPEEPLRREGVRGRWAPALLICLVTFAVGSRAVTLDRRAAIQTAQGELKSGTATSECRDRLVLEHSMDFMAIGYGSDLSASLGETERSRALAQVAVELAPQYPPGLLRVARLMMDEDLDPSIHDWLERLIDTGYTGFQAAMNLVATQARDRPEFLMSFVSRSPRYVVGVSNALTSQGRTRAGAKLLQWGRKHFPESEEVATQLIRQLLREPHNEQTLALIDASAIQYLANSTSVEDPLKSARLKRLGYLAMAHVHSRDGRLEEAWHLFEAAARLDLERDLDARLGQVQILLRQGRYDALERVLNHLDEERVQAEQAQWRVHESWSHLAEARGNLRSAVRAQQRALLFRPRDANLLRRLERLTELRGRPGEARSGRAP